MIRFSNNRYNRLHFIFRKHRLAFIVIAALLTTLVLMFAMRILYAGSTPYSEYTVYEEEGVYDLSGGLTDDAIVVLPPGSLYYPNALLTPDTLISATADHIETPDVLRKDYLSQHFLLTFPKDDHSVYVLTFSVSGRHALRAYVNGTLVGETGTVGTNLSETEVWENTLVCYATPNQGTMDILLNSAQFFHFKHGASLATLTVHKASSAFRADPFSKVEGLLIIGSLLFAALILFFVFFLNPVARETLYFALACLAMVLREYLQSQVWADYDSLSGRTSFMLEYMSLALLTIFLTLYLKQKLTDRLHLFIAKVAIAGSFLYIICLLFTDTLFYTSILIYYQVLLVSCIVIGVSNLFWHMRKPNGEQSMALYGIAVFYFAAVADILLYNNMMQFLGKKISVSEVAMVIFVWAQTLSLFLMHNRLMAEAEENERRLATENAMLDRVNHMKTEFLANISHELKTPLTIIGTYAQSARRSLPNTADLQETQKMMERIDGETARLAIMVSQLLDVSRIDEGRMFFEKKPESLVGIIQSVLENYYPYFAKNHNKLSYHRSGATPTVTCDRNRIIQVLINLISNASKHTREGDISITSGIDGVYAYVEVSDNGEGLDPEQIKHLFNRYYTKNDETRPGIQTGTGLGLFICKYIVEGHGGNITVASIQGSGTTVRFTLPLA